ncbi:MAG: hypothetical protein K9K93_06960 [Acholeplasmataceae bacterium]|nr:hypothetical protein [Acholeplasmataceae bacterium]
MTINKFRTFDLLILSVVAIVIDAVIASFGLFGIRLFVALSFAVMMLGYVRWKKYALFMNALIAIAHMIIHLLLKQDLSIVLAHGMAVMAFSSALIILPIKSRTNTHTDDHLIILKALLCYGVYLVAEWLLMLLFGQSVGILGHLLNHSLNILLTLGLLLIMNHQEDLMTDMTSYLRKKAEREHS